MKTIDIRTRINRAHEKAINRPGIPTYLLLGPMAALDLAMNMGDDVPIDYDPYTNGTMVHTMFGILKVKPANGPTHHPRFVGVQNT